MRTTLKAKIIMILVAVAFLFLSRLLATSHKFNLDLHVKIHPIAHTNFPLPCG